MRFSAASSTVRAMRLARVSGFRADLIHQRMLFFAEAAKCSKQSLAVSLTARAEPKSGGITRSSISSPIVHHPFAFAVSTMRMPAGAIRPCSVSRATFALLMRDHRLFGFRGVNSRIARSSSTRLGRESIQPKHSASSTVLG